MHSLRSRLVAGVALVLLAVGLAAGTLVSHLVDRSERAALDDRLERTAELSRENARIAVQEGLPRADRRLDAVLSATGTSLRLLLGRTVLVDTGAALPGRPAPRLGLRTFTLRGARYRSYATGLRDRNLAGLAVIEVTTPLRALEDRQATLDRRLGLIGLVGLVVAGAGTWLAADLVLRPLRRLRALASSIAGDEDLDRRIPVEPRGPRELRSLAESFDAMLERLGRSATDRERALAATRRFAADAGHELRTPLTSVLTTLSALGRHPEMDDGRRAALVGDALAEHRRFVQLLDGLQALARGDAIDVPESDVDLAEVADAAADAVRGRHRELRLEVRLPDTPVVVRGWEPGLRSVVENLVENAARHGRPGGHVRLSVGAGRRVVVDDDGPGVPEDDRERIFAPFARVNGHERPGSGLGLALVTQQVAHHDGTIAVTDSPLGGARFVVQL